MTELAAAKRAGLDVDLQQDSDGSWSASLTDKTGTVVWTKAGYKNPNSAKGGVGYFLAHTYRRQSRQQPMSSAGGKGLLRQLRTQAQENEKEAVRLYEMADLLGAEAKRLNAAADVLEQSYE